HDPMSGFTALAPFRTRSFRFQWPADLCTAWALEMETLILGWYVLVESGSVVLLTVFGALQFVGTLVSPVIGVLGDRLGLRNVLAGMRVCYAIFASVILFMALTGQLTPMLVLAVAAMSGMVRPTDIGMRSALVGATVPPVHLVAAMGIARTTQDSARIGGALAGAGFMAAFGMAPAYMVITGIYVVGALLTLLIDGQAAPRAAAAKAHAGVGRPSPWRDLKEGLVYVWRTPRLLAAMSLAALVNLTAFPLSGGLMPYIARDVFHLNQQGLGWMVASFASGALIGSLSLSLFGSRVRPARAMLVTSFVWYLALIGFALSTSLPVAMALLMCAGMAQSLSMLTLSILLLRTSEERFRGRIMGVRMLAIYTLPLGLLIAGAMIPSIGFQATALIMVLTGLLLAVWIAVAWREHLVRLDAVGNSR
ncbi:MAG TPA: MFS transporter, partial [Burkholderiaceae bacterium]|nr:MFS transporter [Burkholderiaceae bacterium]